MLDSAIELSVRVPANDDKGREMVEFVQDICSTSPLLSYSATEEENVAAELKIIASGKHTGITFRGIPGGHEFNSLLLAILNADGKGKNLPDEAIRQRINSLRGKIFLTTYASLSCTNCPDVVQSLNIAALCNPNISHTMVDGGTYPDEAEAKGVQAVPSVFADSKLLSVGRATLGELLDLLEAEYGTDFDASGNSTAITRNFDILVLGGGPAGIAAAIYGARKGLSVAVVTRERGGSVALTGAIDNLISTRSTSGESLAAELTANAIHYGAEIFENRTCTAVDTAGSPKAVYTATGETFSADRLIIATGSTPRHLNVKGEKEYTGRGVAFCPHCDGPFFKGKDVVVVGGGNSGIEAAIDLAALCGHVTVLEFMPELKADKVLLDRMDALENVEAHVNRQVLEIIGDGKRVTGLRVKNRTDNTDYTLPIDGIFVQIGTTPNSELFRDKLNLNKVGEIVTDRHCRTSEAGVYAAGDLAESPYKQIVVAIGEGATACLSAFEDMLHSSR